MTSLDGAFGTLGCACDVPMGHLGYLGSPLGRLGDDPTVTVDPSVDPNAGDPTANYVPPDPNATTAPDPTQQDTVSSIMSSGPDPAATDPTVAQATTSPDYAKMVASIASGSASVATAAMNAYQKVAASQGMNATQIAQLLGLAQKKAASPGLSTTAGLGIGALALLALGAIFLASRRRSNPWVSWEGGGRAANPWIAADGTQANPRRRRRTYR